MFTGKTIIFVIRGIAGHPSDQLEWEYELRDKLIRKINRPVVAISYATTFATVWDRRKWRGQRFGHVLRHFTADDWRVHMIMHSEGTVVGSDGMFWAGWPRIESVHYLCGACNSDLERLGVGPALKRNQIGQFHAYVAGQDEAMRWENIGIGKRLFGLQPRSQSMGLRGPTNVSPDLDGSVHLHKGDPWDKYGHSDCWDAENIDRTAAELLNNLRA